MFFIDVQGTLLSDVDKSLIKGARELILFLNSRKLPYVLVTNNTKDLNFLQNLCEKGLEIKENAYIDPFFVLKNFLKPCKIAAFGANEFIKSLENLGFEIDFLEPKALLIASWDEFKFSDFASMIELCQKGVRGICMHATSIYKKNSRSYPGVGAIMKMLNYACGVEFEVIGKPSASFYQAAFELIKKQNQNAKMSEICIISDDYKSDLIEAKKLGMQTKLVLSGKISSAQNCEFVDKIYPSVFEILKELENGN